MRKIILSLSLAAFAASLQAAETNTTAKATAAGDKPKACCPATGATADSGSCAKKADAGQCPAGEKKDCPKADK